MVVRDPAASGRPDIPAARPASRHRCRPALPGRAHRHRNRRSGPDARHTRRRPPRGIQRHGALARLFDYYLVTASVAVEAPGTGRPHERQPGPVTTTVAPPPTDEVTARAWLNAERPNLVAAVRHQADHGQGRQGIDLAAILARDCFQARQHADAAAVYGYASQAARRLGEREAEAQALTGLGNIDRRRGQLTRAADRHRRALAIWRAVGDRRGEAGTLGNLALGHYRLGEYGHAATGFDTVLGIFDDLGDRASVARTLGGCGTVYRYVREAVDLLAGLAPSLAQAMLIAQGTVYPILDGTLIPIDRLSGTADRRYYAGKHKHHGVNVPHGPREAPL